MKHFSEIGDDPHNENDIKTLGRDRLGIHGIEPVPLERPVEGTRLPHPLDQSDRPLWTWGCRLASAGHDSLIEQSLGTIRGH